MLLLLPFLFLEGLTQPAHAILPLGLVEATAVLPLNLDALHVPKEVHDQALAAGGLAALEQVPAQARLAVDLLLVVAVEQVAEGQLAGLVLDLGLEEVEDEVGPAVDDGDADVVVGVVRVAALVRGAAARGDHVGRVEALVQRVGLARVDHEQQLAVAALLPHLRQRVGQVPAADLLGVLELQKLLAAVARHVHQHVAARVAAQPLPARHVVAPPVRQQAQEVLDRHVVAAVVDLDAVAVQVERARRVVVHGARKGVARVARHVVR